ncbi:hypothetical protein FSS13T_03410 [Flavobacterium saliperosum S13]|uniref:Transferrin-binding protein B C-lobe/N-lobe beta barrel domain-containing protein n=2 Tax=Flavobacterium saliperosum TaxID=329186 RepID=A0A1G4V5P2_9FLAO|nr:hypothetical protein [Flavobacterium saliperosum]ESU27860.1 hypothetical protein FSS13T_03410 [Flavobacterium saliperosum S13]SCX01576.1 hypothetical protein SAMN02927925_00359 [Flavobacterium saliperosum]
MKKIILLFVFSMVLASCSDDDSNDTSLPPDDNTLSTAPEAKVEHDASNYGVYKGIFVGSSGTVYVNINNTNTVSAKMVIDGTVYNFTTTEAVSNGQEISGLTFTNGTSSFDFNVLADGENPLINNLNISGHSNASVQIFKEYSFAHIKCYLGTFSGDSVGVFNIATTSDGYALGLALPNDDTFAIYLDGSITGTSITGTFDGGAFSGTINNNTISGTWQNSVPENGTWTGTRKL